MVALFAESAFRNLVRSTLGGLLGLGGGGPKTDRGGRAFCFGEAVVSTQSNMGKSDLGNQGLDPAGSSPVP